MGTTDACTWKDCAKSNEKGLWRRTAGVNCEATIDINRPHMGHVYGNGKSMQLNKKQIDDIAWHHA
jgi:hypothetical protein